MMEDGEAIEKCRSGDKQAFRHLVERYQAQAVAHAAAILGNREDALDAVQEALIDAYRALGRFDAARRFYPWFYVLLRNRCYKMMAARKRSEAENIEEIVILAEPTASREESLALEAALFALAAEDRELVALKYLDGLSYRELAERFEIPVGTVMSRPLSRAQAAASRIERKEMIENELWKRLRLIAKT